MMVDMVYAPDVDVGPAAFRYLGNDHIRVASTFATLQGEGPLSGWPAVFVRLSGCNRGSKTHSCRFCDASFKMSEGIDYPIPVLVDRLKWQVREEFGEAVLPWVVITGGEPMLQPGLPALVEVCLRAGFRVQIESNGDLYQEIEPRALLVVSPKAANGKYSVPNSDVFKRMDHLKILIDGNEAGGAYWEPPREWLIPGHPKIGRMRVEGRVWLSPIAWYKRGLREGEVANWWDHSLVDVEKTRKSLERVQVLCKRYGLRANTQTHLLYGVP